MRLHLPIAVLFLSAFAWTQAPATPGGDGEPLTTIKVATRVVEIAAVVKSKSGEPCGGLTKDDFVLKQDGKEEPIHYFAQGSDLPLTLALMVDTSGSQRTFISDEAEASDVFFESMLGRKQDRAMLVQFDTRVLQLRAMTNSVSALHLSLLNLSSNSTSAAGGTLLNDAVYAVSQNVFAHEAGRKAMIILSDGGDNGSHVSLAQAIEQAQRNDVQVYSILYSAWESNGTALSGGPNSMPGMSRNTADPGQAALEKLSENTGGRVFTVTRALTLREIFARIAQDLRLQYELGYTPPPDVQANSYHKLEVRARDKKLVVQARKGFFVNP